MMTTRNAFALLCAIGLLCLAASTPARAFGHPTGRLDREELRTAFIGYKVEYDLDFGSVAEDGRRFQVFVENMRRADQLNSEGNGEAEYGITRFFHLTPAEFSDLMLAPMPTENRNLGVHQDLLDLLKTAGTPPQSVNWVAKGMVTPVENQAMCGSCWAFSASENVASIGAIQTGDLIQLSAQQLVDCSKQNHGCEGGLPLLADQYYEKNGAIALADYPYRAIDGPCNYNKKNVVFNVGNSTQIPQSPTKILTALATIGPLSLGINAAPLQYYRGGVMSPSALFCDPKRLDHGVLYVGYDISAATPYLTIKNSWGSAWGEEGYFRIKYETKGDGICGAYTMVSTALQVTKASA